MDFPLTSNRLTLISSTQRLKLRGWVLKAIFLLFLLVFSVNAHADFNKYEIKIITERIESAFSLLIDTWNEELYFEMYDLGQRSSQMRLSRGEFAQRMVDLKWKPSLKPIRIDKIEIIYMNYAAIYFWQEFENKVNMLQKVEKYMTLPTILESNNWKFDLTQLIRIPYEGKFKEQPPKEAPPVENTPPPSTPIEGAPPADAGVITP